jgi:hypothetical protein
MCERLPLAEVDLRKGQTVIYTGPDNSREIYEEHTRPRKLCCGHPGRIADPTRQHIRVHWVGLEHEPISYAAGFCLERDGFVPGLSAITESEYKRLAEQVWSISDREL